jgi:hypothetical protein
MQAIMGQRERRADSRDATKSFVLEDGLASNNNDDSVIIVTKHDGIQQQDLWCCARFQYAM